MSSKTWWILIGAAACLIFGGYSYLIAYIIVMIGAKILSYSAARREIKALLILIGIGYGYYKAGVLGAAIAALLIGCVLFR
ncbi:MAG: hypothetical protein IJX63_06030 [Lachnospiraceae bacterium]|nr:hypothetical protein [Lachnospiraceae bacterium]